MSTEKLQQMGGLCTDIVGIINTIGDARSRALARTKLDEMNFWISRGILIDDQTPPPVTE